MRLSIPNDLLDAVRADDDGYVRDRVRADPALVHAADDHAKTLLHWAAEFDRAALAAVLLDAGADLEARTSWGATPFDWAATMGSGHVADLLLDRGATGLSLVTAAALGRLGFVREVVEGGADLSMHRRRGAPDGPTSEWPADTAWARGDVLSDALHAAARNGQTAVVEYLADRGADIDATGFFGATGLHWAAIRGHRDTVAFLLARGAVLDRRDARFGATAEGWAREGGHDAIAEILRSHGARE